MAEKRDRNFAPIERDLIQVEAFLSGELDEAPKCEVLDLELAGTELKEVRRALTQLKRGTYGVCIDCREQIGIERLRVRPLTHLCRHCIHADEVRERAISARLR